MAGLHRSVTEADPEGARGLDDLAVDRHLPHFSYRLGNLDRHHIGGLERYHVSEPAFVNELHGADAEARAKDTVEVGGPAAALEVAEDDDPSFFVCTFLDFLGNDFSDTAQACFVFVGCIAGGDVLAACLHCAFCDDDKGEVFVLGFAFGDFPADTFIVKRDFRDEDYVRASGDARIGGDPPGVSSHYFEYHDAVMAFGGRVEAVQCIGCGGDGGIEAEGHYRGLEVVIDSLGHADHGHAVFVKLLCYTKRAVAADADEGLERELIAGTFCGVEDLFRDSFGFAEAGFGDEPSLVCRAEDGAAAEEESVQFFIIEDFIGDGVQEAFEAVDKANCFESALGRGFDHRANNGV